MKSGPFMEVLLVGAGGAVGAMLRHVISSLSYRAIPVTSFPHGTLVVNVIGCFTIGLLGGWIESKSAVGHPMRFFLVAGLLGGFTTFSAFGHETMSLLRDGGHAKAALNVGLHILLCLLATAIGYAITSR